MVYASARGALFAAGQPGRLLAGCAAHDCPAASGNAAPPAVGSCTSIVQFMSAEELSRACRRTCLPAAFETCPQFAVNCKSFPILSSLEFTAMRMLNLTRRVAAWTHFARESLLVWAENP